MSDLALDLVFAVILYVVLLLVIGALARQARRDRSLSDFVLAGRTIGFPVLLLTLFATQYSGNSFSGFPGQTYREGLAYFMSVTFTIAIVSGYVLIAPRLFALSRKHGFVTPTDYLDHRFGSPALHFTAVAIFVVALGNFLLAQLIAMGNALSALTDGQVPYWTVVVGGAVVVLAYQLMGGMRAVAWTDVFQGMLLVVGLLLVSVLLWMEVGSPASVVRTAQLLQPDMVATPGARTSAVWLSNLALLALGAPLYPQLIQRIYAARRLRELRASLATLAVLPLFTTTTAIFIGVAAIALFPEMDRLGADQVTFRIVTYLVESTDVAYYPALIVMMAIVAAIMSTADSCLLSLSSIVVKDVVGRARGLRGEAAERLTGLVPVVSIAAMVVVVLLAMWPHTTLWGLLIIKFEILIQLSPAFVLGTLHEPGDPEGYGVREILAGIFTGLAVMLALYLSGWENVFGFQAGAIGAAMNYAVVLAVRRASAPRGPARVSLRVRTAARRDALSAG